MPFFCCLIIHPASSAGLTGGLPYSSWCIIGLAGRLVLVLHYLHLDGPTECRVEALVGERADVRAPCVDWYL